MRFDPTTITNTIYTRFGQSSDDYNPYTEFQNEDGSFEYSTLGPGNNEGVQAYSFNEGSHKIRYVHYISPDILLVHQSKMVGFHKRMRSSEPIKPIDRSVKNRLLRTATMR